MVSSYSSTGTVPLKDIPTFFLFFLFTQNSLYSLEFLRDTLSRHFDIAKWRKFCPPSAANITLRRCETVKFGER